MTNLDAIEILDNIKCIFGKNAREAIAMAILALERETEVNVFDKEEIYHDCTVQVLTNTATGDVSVGWWRDE